MTPDRRRVAFVSSANDLVADLPAAEHLFLRDLRARSTVVVSADAGGVNVVAARLSANGRFVAFVNPANTVFRTDTKKGTTSIASVSRVGVAASATSFSSMSADGRFVGFTSNGIDLVAGDTNARTDAFVRDVARGTTLLLSVLPAGTNGGNANSSGPVLLGANGRIAAFGSGAEDLVAPDGNFEVDVFVRPVR